MSGVMPKFDLLDPNLSDPDTSPLDELVHARIELRKVLESLSFLTPKEVFILSKYCFEDYSLCEIAKILGLTEARVCQIKDKALDQLARASSAGLDP
jgi:RNA polymerase sigma factor for flagellar operon FliA